MQPLVSQESEKRFKLFSLLHFYVNLAESLCRLSVILLCLTVTVTLVTLTKS